MFQFPSSIVPWRYQNRIKMKPQSMTSLNLTLTVKSIILCTKKAKETIVWKKVKFQI